MLFVPDSNEKMMVLLGLIGNKVPNVTDDTLFLMGARKHNSGGGGAKWMYANGQPMGQYEAWITG